MSDKIKVKLPKKLKEAIFSSAVADGKKIFPEERLFDEIDDLDNVLANIGIYKIIYLNSLEKLLGNKWYRGLCKGVGFLKLPRLLNFRWMRCFGDLQIIQDFEESKKYLIYYEKRLLNQIQKLTVYQEDYLGIFSLECDTGEFISELDICNLDLSKNQYKAIIRKLIEEDIKEAEKKKLEKQKNKIIDFWSQELTKYKFNIYFFWQVYEYFDYDKRIEELVKDFEISEEELKKYLSDESRDLRKSTLNIMKFMAGKGRLKNISAYNEDIKKVLQDKDSDIVFIALGVLKIMVDMEDNAYLLKEYIHKEEFSEILQSRGTLAINLLEIISSIYIRTKDENIYDDYKSKFFEFAEESEKIKELLSKLGKENEYKKYILELNNN